MQKQAGELDVTTRYEIIVESPNQMNKTVVLHILFEVTEAGKDDNLFTRWVGQGK